MSDTPKTDAFEALLIRPVDWWDFARELERENAALNHALNIAQTELRLNGCAKAADEVAKLHDAARKEAQP